MEKAAPPPPPPPKPTLIYDVSQLTVTYIGGTMKVSATGQTPEFGWKNPTLVLTDQDGMVFTYDFMATPPSGFKSPAFSPISAEISQPVTNPPSGVYINTATNGLEWYPTT